MIIVNPIQSFTEQDMSDDPIYPSPTVKGQKGTTPEHKGLICAPLATIKVGHRRLQKQEVFFFFFLIQLILTVRIRVQCSEWLWGATVRLHL